METLRPKDVQRGLSIRCSLNASGQLTCTEKDRGRAGAARHGETINVIKRATRKKRSDLDIPDGHSLSAEANQLYIYTQPQSPLIRRKARRIVSRCHHSPLIRRRWLLIEKGVTLA